MYSLFVFDVEGVQIYRFDNDDLKIAIEAGENMLGVEDAKAAFIVEGSLAKSVHNKMVVFFNMSCVWGKIK